MTNSATANVEMIAAERERRLIPENLAKLFDETSNEMLQSMAQDPKLSDTARANCRHELTYRDAFKVVVTIDPRNGIARHHRYRTDEEAIELNGLLEREDAALHTAGETARKHFLASLRKGPPRNAGTGNAQ